MRFARMENLDDIMEIFKNSVWLVNISRNKIRYRIKRKQVIFEHGVVLVFSHYKRSYAGFKKNEWKLRQIVSRSPGNGWTQVVLDKFLKKVDNDLYLDVRKDNKRALRFYHKNGFRKYIEHPSYDNVIRMRKKYF